MEIAPLASAIASIATAVGGVVAAGGLTRRLARIQVGRIEIEFLGQKKESLPDDPREAAEHLVASFGDVSATEYALDPATRSRIDGSIDQALAQLEADFEPGEQPQREK